MRNTFKVKVKNNCQPVNIGASVNNYVNNFLTNYFN